MAAFDILTSLDKLENRQDYLDDAQTMEWIKMSRLEEKYEDSQEKLRRREGRDIERLGYVKDAQTGLDISNQYEVWLKEIQDTGLSLEEIRGAGIVDKDGIFTPDTQNKQGFKGAFSLFQKGMKDRYQGDEDALGYVNLYGQGVQEAYDIALRSEEGSQNLIALMEQLRKKDYGSTVANVITIQDIIANTERAQVLAIENDQIPLAKALESLRARAINQDVVKGELRKYTHSPYSGMEGEPETVNLLKHPGRAAAYTGEIPLEDTDMIRSMEFFSENAEQYHKLKEVQLRAEAGDWIGARKKLDTFHQNVVSSEAYTARLKETLKAAKLKTNKEIREESEKVQRIEQMSFAKQFEGRRIDFGKEDFADTSKEAKAYMVRLKSFSEAVNYTEANWTPETSVKAITTSFHALADEIWRQEGKEKAGVEVFEEHTDLVGRDDYETQAILLSGVGSVVDGKEGRGIRLNTNFGTTSDREFKWYKKFDKNNKLKTITPLSEINLSRIDPKRQADALEETTGWNLPWMQKGNFRFGDFKDAPGSGSQVNIGEAMKNASLLYLSVQPEYIKGKIRQAEHGQGSKLHDPKSLEILSGQMDTMATQDDLKKQIKSALSDNEFDVTERIQAVDMAQKAGLKDIGRVLNLLAEENLLTPTQAKKFEEDWKTWSVLKPEQKKAWHKQWGGL